MALNRVQFQAGRSMAGFIRCCGNGANCCPALDGMR